MIVAFAVGGAIAVIVASAWLLRILINRFCCECCADDDLMADQDGHSEGSDTVTVEMEAVPAPPMGAVAEWERPKGLCPGDDDYRNKFIRGGL